MEVINLPISEVKPYENNPRINDGAVEATAKSIKEFGWQQPIVVDKDKIIIVGHTRLKAAKSLGLSEVPVIIANTLTDEQVKAYRLADNKTGDFSFWDNKKLLDELIDISDEVFTGFDPSDIFDDVLDESDTSPLDEASSGIVYTINFRTQDKLLYEKVKNYIHQEDKDSEDIDS